MTAQHTDKWHALKERLVSHALAGWGIGTQAYEAISQLERELAAAADALVLEKSRSTDLALELEKAKAAPSASAKKGPLGGYPTPPAGTPAVQLDFMLTQLQGHLEATFDPEIDPDDFNFHAAVAIEIKQDIINKFAPPEAAKQDDLPLRCEAVDGALDMRIGVKVLAFATENCPALWNAEADKPGYRVTDPVVFAKEVERELNRESEDGSTRLSRMLDAAIDEAINQGAEGVTDACSGPEQRK